ncbi:putative GMP synthase [Daphnia magna]|uniref:Putative GMP synthase n=1 Tax=Daphnia magna TaxID=35525 RepID=A0A162SJW3_9CRUS|nr:putative GMP synthase [Daphnia magna]
MFVKVVDRTANDLNVTWNNLLLGQVALIPDLIESTSHMASSRADAIKTHNGSEMVRQLCIYGRVVEPLKELFLEADFVETQVGFKLRRWKNSVFYKDGSLPCREIAGLIAIA